MMKKKWMAAALSMMVAGGVVAGVTNHPAFAAAPQTAKTSIKQHVDKADQDGQDNDKEVADSVEQAQLAKKATITQQQSIDIATKQVAGSVLKSELEDENGAVVYSVTIKDNQGQEKEIHVDAKTGSIVKVENENQQNGHDTETNNDANG
jgi:uncharacterized membrane protein YkoI